MDVSLYQITLAEVTLGKVDLDYVTLGEAKVLMMASENQLLYFGLS